MEVGKDAIWMQKTRGPRTNPSRSARSTRNLSLGLLS